MIVNLTPLIFIFIVVIGIFKSNRFDPIVQIVL